MSDLDDLRALNRAAGGFYFEPETLKVFGSKNMTARKVEGGYWYWEQQESPGLPEWSGAYFDAQGKQRGASFRGTSEQELIAMFRHRDTEQGENK